MAKREYYPEECVRFDKVNVNNLYLEPFKADKAAGDKAEFFYSTLVYNIGTPQAPIKRRLRLEGPSMETERGIRPPGQYKDWSMFGKLDKSNPEHQKYIGVCMQIYLQVCLELVKQKATIGNQMLDMFVTQLQAVMAEVQAGKWDNITKLAFFFEPILFYPKVDKKKDYNAHPSRFFKLQYWDGGEKGINKTPFSIPRKAGAKALPPVDWIHLESHKFKFIPFERFDDVFADAKWGGIKLRSRLTAATMASKPEPVSAAAPDTEATMALAENDDLVNELASLIGGSGGFGASDGDMLAKQLASMAEKQPTSSGSPVVPNSNAPATGMYSVPTVSAQQAFHQALPPSLPSAPSMTLPQAPASAPGAFAVPNGLTHA